MYVKVGLTLLHSKRPKLYTILAFLSAKGVNISTYDFQEYRSFRVCVKKFSVLSKDFPASITNCHQYSQFSAPK